MPPGVYLHIPFCKSRCSYCDFATDVYRDAGTVERYVDAISSEVAAFGVAEDRTTPSAKLGHPSFGSRGVPSIDSVYFGGGTPSLLSPHQVGKILSAVRNTFVVSDAPEITMEMNPATVTPETLAAFRASGINRASFGVQTFNDRDLKLLARGHDANDARNTFRMLRDAGFDNVSFDLIAGLPGQTIEDWKRNLDEAVAMQPEHLSLYLLEVHEATPLAEQLRSGRRPMPDEAVAAESYEMMIDMLEVVGYEQYEISNFAKPGFRSRHNSKYWRLDPVYGFGVSAHSFDGSQRYANERDTAAYVRLIDSGGPAEVSRESVDAASEFVFLGLRLTDGIDLEEYKARFNDDLVERYRHEVDDLLEKELIDITDTRMRLTRRGMLFSNEVFSAFV